VVSPTALGSGGGGGGGAVTARDGPPEPDAGGGGALGDGAAFGANGIVGLAAARAVGPGETGCGRKSFFIGSLAGPADGLFAESDDVEAAFRGGVAFGGGGGVVGGLGVFGIGLLLAPGCPGVPSSPREPDFGGVLSCVMSAPLTSLALASAALRRAEQDS